MPSFVFLFERGKEFERGLRPLSPIFPSPTIYIQVLLYVSGWRGIKGEANAGNVIEYYRLIPGTGGKRRIKL
jgi:hypothetical protein